jgi:hypothetical protein
MKNIHLHIRLGVALHVPTIADTYTIQRRAYRVL